MKIGENAFDCFYINEQTKRNLKQIWPTFDLKSKISNKNEFIKITINEYRRKETKRYIQKGKKLFSRVPIIFFKGVK